MTRSSCARDLQIPHASRDLFLQNCQLFLSKLSKGRQKSSNIDELIRQLVFLVDELLLISILAVDFFFFLPSAGGRPRPAPATFFVVDLAAMITRASASLGD